MYNSPGRQAKVNGVSRHDEQASRKKSLHEEDATHHGLGTLAMCAAGICGCYLYFGILQERLFTGDHPMGATFTLVTACLTNAIVALFWQKALDLWLQPVKISTHTSNNNDDPRPLNHTLFLLTSGFYVCAMTCSNEAIHYVSYPVAVLAKSCKLIPTMIIGQMVEKRFYSFEEWLAVVFISCGIVMFHFSRISPTAASTTTTTATAKSSAESTQFGMALLLVSLLMDGFLSSSQNMLKRDRAQYRSPSAVETMLYVNLYALVYLIPLSMFQGQWDEGVTALALSSREEVNHQLVWNVILLNLVVGFGQIFIFLTIQWYSPVVVTTVTTTRKFFTILLSVWTFGHHFSAIQWSAIVLVFVGLYVIILVQHRKFKKHQKQD